MSCLALIRFFCGAVALNLAIVGSVCAAPYYSIGPKPCDKQTLQQALNDINKTSPPTLEFHVLAINASGGFPTDEPGPIVITGKTLSIYGGYASCDAPEPQEFNGSDISVLSELNGGRFPGHATIEIKGESNIEIRNYNINSASNSTHEGGGISFTSGGLAGRLQLQNVFINSNHAGVGAGIYYDGHASLADTLVLSDYSIIQGNTADYGGGGIHLRGNTHLIASTRQTSISNNKVDPFYADGHGGGLDLIGNSSADIGSPGYYQFAVIDGNHAPWGGGISARDQANVRVFTTKAGAQTRIENNISPAGGGVFLGSGNGHPQLCGYGAGINGNQTAILSMGTPGQVIPINFNDTCNSPDGEVPCMEGVPCNTIDGNLSGSDKAVTVKVTDTIFLADRIRIQGNGAGHLLQIDGNDLSSFSNCLISDNHVFGSRGVVDVGAPVNFNGCTFTNDSGILRGLFDTSDAPVAPFLTLQNSIVAEGLKTFVDIPTLYIDVLNSIAKDANSYTSDFNTRVNFSQLKPTFLNSRLFGDYHLSRSSSGLDYYAKSIFPPYLCGGLGLDLDGRPRGILVNNADSLCDLGAYEHQALPPVTFPSNETFDELDSLVPELPPNWINGISSNSVDNDNTRGWLVTSSLPFTGPFAAHAIDPGGANAQSDSTLDSPEFAVVHSGRLTFYTLFSLEPGYDGAVLEISIAGGVFQEMTKAGGVFVSGGYNGILQQGATRNPIELGCPLCPAWTWNSGPDPTNYAGYQYVEVNLPPSANGKKVRLRWRLGSDGNGPELGGFWLDDVHVDAGMLDDKIFVNSFGIADDRSI